MSTYGWAHIIIGGEYKGTFESFEKVLKDSGLMRDIATLMDLQRDQEVHDPRSSVDEFYINEERCISISDSEADHATFPALEAFCRYNGLSYVRHSDAVGEFDAETTYWVPGMKSAVTINTDRDNDPVVRLNAIRLAAEQAEDLDAFRAWLNENHPQVPDIPPFQIV